MERPPATLLIACGALASEARTVLQQDGLRHVTLSCLPAKLHNTPALIPDLLRQKIRENRSAYTDILVLYGDCGTGGKIDEVLAEEGASRIAGAHCYEFYSGSNDFDRLAEEEPGTFYLTDFLVRHFDRLVWQGLGLDSHPELLSSYFGNYSRLVYLAQLPSDDSIGQAKQAARRLGLDFVLKETGLGKIDDFLSSVRVPKVTRGYL